MASSVELLNTKINLKELSNLVTIVFVITFLCINVSVSLVDVPFLNVLCGRPTANIEKL